MVARSDLVTYHVVVQRCRQLVSVRDSKTVLGSVMLDDIAGTFDYDGAAGNVLGGLRRELGDKACAEAVIADGWGNAAGLYFGEVIESA